MSNLEVSHQAGKKSKKREIPPPIWAHENWHVESSYEEGGVAVSDWTGLRWAWEFLRRNPEYQEVSKKYAGKPMSIDPEVTRRFGVWKILRCSDPWTSKHDTNWRLNSFVKAHNSFQFLPNALSDAKFSLSDGEIAIVFDVKQALMGGGQAIDAMLSKARLFLNDELEYIENHLSESAVQYPKPSENFQTLFSYLRVYDAQITRAKNNEIAAVLFKDIPELIGKDEYDKDLLRDRAKNVSSRVSKLSLPANKYVYGGYAGFVIYP